MSAIAAYVYTLSKQLGGGRTKLQRASGISIQRIAQIEGGKGEEPSLRELAILVNAVGGNFADVQQLVLHNMTEEDGVRLAKEHINRMEKTVLKQQIDALNRQELIDVIRYAADRLDQIM